MKRKHVRPLPWATPEQAKEQRESLIKAGIILPEKGTVNDYQWAIAECEVDGAK